MEKRTILHILAIITLASVLLSCDGRNSRFAQQLDMLDTLMLHRPDSAYNALLGMAKEADTQRKPLRMRYALTLADAQNKAYVDFTSDSVMKEVVEYYDLWGSDAERMRSHYLLGCVYRDKGDAPYAIRCFTDAVSFADTTSTDCDYNMLGKIYGQMTDAYLKSFLPELAKETVPLSVRCMYQTGDTLSALIFKEDMLNVYNFMGQDSLSAALAERVADEYKANDMESMSYYSLLAAINSHIKIGNTRKASSLMSRIDSLVSLYNKGVIPFEPSHYYCYKAICFNDEDRLDSALHYCNKALSSKYSHTVAIHAYGCLMSVYEKKHDYALSNKYARLYCAANDSSLIRHSLDAVNKLHAEYNYNRAEKSKAVAEHKLYLTYVTMVMAFLLLTLLAVWGWHRYCLMRKRQQSEIAAMNKDYNRLLHEYDQAKNDYALLQTDFDSYMQEKENCIEDFRKQLEAFACSIADSGSAVVDDGVANSNMVKHIRKQIAAGITPTNDEVRNLKLLVEESYPIFWSTVTHPQHNLTEQEIRACIFMRLFFIPSEIAFVMSMSLQRVTNIKSRINLKLFGEKGAKGLVEKLSRLS